VKLRYEVWTRDDERVGVQVDPETGRVVAATANLAPGEDPVEAIYWTRFAAEFNDPRNRRTWRRIGVRS
jgi:hypothetical protein